MLSHLFVYLYRQVGQELLQKIAKGDNLQVNEFSLVVFHFCDFVGCLERRKGFVSSLKVVEVVEGEIRC
jgi:methyl coenzyme M reductase subunit C-like uncharacterized protein (methanogenesis marker protein 7)